MIKYLMIAALCMLSACTTLSALPSADSTLIDEKLMYGAEAAYNVPAHAYVTADSAGQLPPALKATVKPYLIKAFDALVVVRCAYNAVNLKIFGAGCPAGSFTKDAFNSAYNLVKSNSNQATALIPAPI